MPVRRSNSRASHSSAGTRPWSRIPGPQRADDPFGRDHGAVQQHAHLVDPRLQLMRIRQPTQAGELQFQRAQRSSDVVVHFSCERKPLLLARIVDAFREVRGEAAPGRANYVALWRGIRAGRGGVAPRV